MVAARQQGSGHGHELAEAMYRSTTPITNRLYVVATTQEEGTAVRSRLFMKNRNAGAHDLLHEPFMPA